MEQSASPRAAVASSLQLKRHQSDIAQHVLPDSWQGSSALTSIVRTLLVCTLLQVPPVHQAQHNIQDVVHVQFVDDITGIEWI